MADHSHQMGKAREGCTLCEGDCSADAEGVLSLFIGTGMFPQPGKGVLGS